MKILEFGSSKAVVKRLYLLLMGIRGLSISALYSVLSFIGLHLWTDLKLAKLREDGLIGDHFIYSGNAGTAWELLLGSYATVALIANFYFSLFTLLISCLKLKH